MAKQITARKGLVVEQVAKSQPLATSPEQAQTPAAVARRPASKFEPNPEARASKKEGQAQGAPAAPQRFLELGGGFKMMHKPGSAHSTVVRILAKEGKFVESEEILSSTEFDPSDKSMAIDLLSKLFVRKDSLERLVRNDPIWKAHASKRFEDLESRSTEGDTKAKKTLENESRVKDGKWLCNVKEIISTCAGSYADQTGDPAGKKKRNVRKFRDAGLIFRQYPLKAKSSRKKRDDPVFLMLYPTRHVQAVRKAIETAFGVVEEQEETR
jgi:hypothetical protein